MIADQERQNIGTTEDTKEHGGNQPLINSDDTDLKKIRKADIGESERQDLTTDQHR
jgi:hypothetical protein